MRIAALVSGGKDSLYSAYEVSRKNKLGCLIAIKSKNKESYMFHIPNIELVKLQAKSMELPLIFLETKGEKEKELVDLEEAVKKAVKKYKIDGLVSGAIQSNYQRKRIEKICKKLKIKSITPLWHINENSYIKKLKNFEIIITGIAADCLDIKDLGRSFDSEFVKKLKSLNISPLGEGGEFESLVLNCPLFKKRIIIQEAIKKMDSEFSGVYNIKKAKLI